MKTRVSSSEAEEGVKVRLKNDLKRLENYERVLGEVLSGKREPCQIWSRHIAAYKRELHNTAIVIGMIKKLLNIKYNGFFHDDICRDRIKINHRRIYDIIQDISEVKEDELRKIITFLST